MRHSAILAGAVAALLVSGCSLDVTWQESTRTDGPGSPPIYLPVYPHAKPVTPPLPPEPADLTFTGRFAETSVHSEHFATADDVDLVREFYRDAMGQYGEPLGCRGTINVRARRRTEELTCLRRGTPDSTQLVVSVPGQHAIVTMTPANTGSTFTIVNVGTRH